MIFPEGLSRNLPRSLHFGKSQNSPRRAEMGRAWQALLVYSREATQ